METIFTGEGCPESVFSPNANLEALVDTDLDTLATALYVTTDDLLRAHPEHVPLRPKVGDRTEDLGTS